MKRQGAGEVFQAEWVIPALYAGLALAAGIILPRVEHLIFPELLAPVSSAAAMSFYSAIASGMITLTGIVFSLTFVMVQFSATAYSPRLVQWISRDRVVSHSLGVFSATFLYAIAALIRVDRGGDGNVPFISGWIVVGLLLASTGMFVALIHRISRLRVDQMLVFTGDMGRAVISCGPGAQGSPEAAAIREIQGLPLCQTLVHTGSPRAIQAVDVESLVALASSRDAVIEMVTAVGDTVVERTPLLRVRGAGIHFDEQKLTSAIRFGMERTFEQDPKYAIRLLVDIAIKALSPAINDPTTAVQALDQIEDLLSRLAQGALDAGAFRDASGKVRLLTPSPDWDDLLALAFSEIAYCGATSVQVMRRMNALVADLSDSVPEECRPALARWSERLKASVERTFSNKWERDEALEADRQGLGATRAAQRR